MSECLFTVTCNRDRWLFINQYKSVNKYLKKCKWYIIVNESDSIDYHWYQYYTHVTECFPDYPSRNYTDWVDWFENVRESTPHDIHIISLDEVLSKLSPEVQSYFLNTIKTTGYYRQILLKLLIHLFCSEEKIITLDSKNWIAKNCELSDFTHQHKKTREESSFYGTIDFAQKRWNIETPYVTANITPYILHKSTLEKFWKEFNDENTGIIYLSKINWKAAPENKILDDKKYFPSFDDQRSMMSEFHMYDIFCQKYNIHQNEVTNGNIYYMCSLESFKNKDDFLNSLIKFKDEQSPLTIAIKWYRPDEQLLFDGITEHKIVNIIVGK